MRRRSVLRAFVAVGLIRVATPLAAQVVTVPAARDAALNALAARLNLPLVDESIAIFSTQLRRTLPTYFVSSLGQNVNLGANWRPGDRVFDEAVRQTDLALGQEESRNGPLLRLERGDLLLAVNIPWTEDDIAFVQRTLPTDLGHEAERAIDAKAVQQTIATLRRRVTAGTSGESIRRSFDDLDARARSQFGDASLMLLALKGSNPAPALRLQRLVEQVTVLPSDAIGQRIVDRLSQRLLNAAANYLPQLLQNIAASRGLR